MLFKEQYKLKQKKNIHRQYLKISIAPKISDCLLQTIKSKNTRLCSTEITKQFAGEC